MYKPPLIDESDVHDTFVVCSARCEGDGPRIVVKGFVLDAVFITHRLRYYQDDIRHYLGQFPRRFYDDYHGYRGRWHEMLQDRGGAYWTRTHRIVDELVCLGLAINMVRLRRAPDIYTILG